MTLSHAVRLPLLNTIESFRRHARSMGVACLFSVSGCAALPEPPLTDGDFAILDVAVISMHTERVDEHRTVVVAAGRIAAVAPTDAIHLSPGVRKVDGRGRFLIPGMADMHVHIWSEPELALYVANGVTLVRNMAGDAVALDRRRRIAEGTLVGPRMITAGPLTDGDPPSWSFALVVNDASEACMRMAEQKRQGYDFLKIYNSISSDTFDGIVACSRSTGFPFAGHVPDAVGMDRMIRGGARSIEHLTGYDDAERRADGPLRARGSYPDRRSRVIDRVAVAERVERGEIGWPDVFDLSRRDALAALLAQERVWSVPTLVTNQRILTPRSRMADELRRPEIRYVSPLTRASWAPDNDFRRKSLSDHEQMLVASYFSQDLARVKALKRAGAPLLVGTDAPNPFVVHGFAEHDELELMVRAGLTNYEALSAATTEPARFIGESGRSGIIAPGARADLVLLEANPLDDIRATRRIEGVSLAGRWLPRKELHAMLARTEATFAIPDDWFANVSPPPGLATTSMLMKTQTAGIDTGAERHQLTETGRSWRLLAQLSTRDGDAAVVTVSGSAGTDGALEVFDYRRESVGTVTRAHLRREGETVWLDGIDAAGGAVTGHAAAAPYIGCDLAACVAPLLPALRGLATASRLEVPVLMLEIWPQLEITPERWTLIRDPDPAPGHGAAHIEASRGKAEHALRVRWDEHGLVAVNVDGDLGNVETSRVAAK